MKSIRTFAGTARRLLQGRIPGQLVIQVTDRCNATCPQCGMRKTNAFQRTQLSFERIRSIIDAAGRKGIAAISFTGGEPMLLRKDLPDLIRHAGRAGIPYIRTGTNGFFFMHHKQPDFKDRIKRLAGELAATPLRNFWISLDSAVPEIHEGMRGFDGIVAGMDKALPLFHEAGIYPSVNLGLNRNLVPETRALGRPDSADLKSPEDSPFYRAFARGFETFYRRVIEMGFTIANACYPMSMEDDPDKASLSAVYAATSPDRVVCFTPTEKALLFKALMDTIPKFRSKLRIFSPLTALLGLFREYAAQDGIPRTAPCRGGIDFFFVNCRDGSTTPCGYRGSENLGPFEALDLDGPFPVPFCRACDWECFRDPSELAHPVKSPGILFRDKRLRRVWLKDLAYYRACACFDGRTPPDYGKLGRF